MHFKQKINGNKFARFSCFDVNYCAFIWGYGQRIRPWWFIRSNYFITKNISKISYDLKFNWQKNGNTNDQVKQKISNILMKTNGRKGSRYSHFDVNYCAIILGDGQRIRPWWWIKWNYFIPKIFQNFLIIWNLFYKKRGHK